MRAGLPLHGPNLFPRQVPELRAAVLDYIGALTDLGQAVLRGVALSLGLDADYFAAGYTASPTVLFRVFRYPAPPPGDDGWGVGEHTDYGLLTLLAQDDNGGLQVEDAGRLDRRAADRGHLRGQHRRHARPADRRLVPVDAAPGAQRQRPGPVLLPVLLRPRLHRRDPAAAGAGRGRATAAEPRWDGQNLHAFSGTYGDYLLGKVSKVFPQLRRRGTDRRGPVTGPVTRAARPAAA